MGHSRSDAPYPGQLTRSPVSADIGDSWSLAALSLAVAEIRLSSQFFSSSGRGCADPQRQVRAGLARLSLGECSSGT
jgi:hypothetical protein